MVGFAFRVTSLLIFWGTKLTVRELGTVLVPRCLHHSFGSDFGSVFRKVFLASEHAWQQWRGRGWFHE